MNTREALARIFTAAVEAVRPENAVRECVERDGNRLRIGGENLDIQRFASVTILGAGKGAAPMVAALEPLVEDRLQGGEVVVKYGHTEKLSRCGLREAGHPEPDAQGQAATERLMARAEALGADDLLLVALTGGASSLLVAPASGLSLEDKQRATRLLLGCGADIHEMNALRKHLSRVKGGRLARLAYPATVRVLLVSDVVGDDLDVIGSGPMAPDSTTFRDAWAVVERYGLETRLPDAARHIMKEGLAGRVTDTPKAGDACFEKVRHHLLATNRRALDAAAKCAEQLGFRAEIITDRLVGDAEEAAKSVAEKARKTKELWEKRPVCLLFGGETTVSLREGHGRGGRNQHLALALALEFANEPHLSALAAGTDGSDGPTDAAGAFVTTETVENSNKRGLSAKDALKRQNSYPYFEATGDLFVTGPTRTNVMDLTLVLVEPS